MSDLAHPRRTREIDKNHATSIWRNNETTACFSGHTIEQAFLLLCTMQFQIIERMPVLDQKGALIMARSERISKSRIES